VLPASSCFVRVKTCRDTAGGRVSDRQRLDCNLTAEITEKIDADSVID